MTIERSFWDGHTDYTVRMTDEEEREKLENYAKWIEEEDSFVFYKHNTCLETDWMKSIVHLRRFVRFEKSFRATVDTLPGSTDEMLTQSLRVDSRSQ